MDPIARVNAIFAESAQASAAAVESQAGSIARAAQSIVDSLLGGGKVLCCGNGCSAADAQYFAAQLLHRFERERPGLPALALSVEGAVLSAIAGSEGFDQVYATQIGVLGHPGDVLVTMHARDASGGLLPAIAAAQDRQLRVIALTGSDGDAVSASLHGTDIEIRSPAIQVARILENHRLVIHCLCDLIDLQLMGG